MNRLFCFILFVIHFIGCQPFEYDDPQYGKHLITIDATNSSYSNSTYYVYKVDAFYDTLFAGDTKNILIDYFASTVCQVYPYESSSCVQDTLGSGSDFILTGEPMSDLIKVKINPDLQITKITRGLFSPSSFFNVNVASDVNQFTLPAQVNSQNRLVFFKEDNLVIDTVFYVDTLSVSISI